MPKKKATPKKVARKRTTKSTRVKTDRISAAKEKADKGSPPAKRATRLAYPELADEGWLKGNPDAAKNLET